MVRKLILILGDQLSQKISSLRSGDPGKDRVLIAEVMDEASYVRHHPKKIALVFSAMRHFAIALREAGWTVDYVRLDDADNTGSIDGEIGRAVKRCSPDKVIATEPGEWRLLELLRQWNTNSQPSTELLPDNRFICSKEAFSEWSEGRGQLRMEHFYHEMRRETGLLMDGGQPVGGSWNFDEDNRKPAHPDSTFRVPLKFDPDQITLEVLKLVENKFGENFGDLHPFWFGVTKDAAQKSFAHFIREGLPSFGDYQDAMLSGQNYLFHSVISIYLNLGLLDPMDLCRAAEDAYNAGDAPINAVEGFIRQIIGWREFVRGIYWQNMPGYHDANFFGADRNLPDFYWTGKTKMRCIREAVNQTKSNAYAHHIQRLMVTGNFALIAGIDPRQVHEWYLAVYADAYEWVEMPNTIGMSQFADGGVLASKPYASGGNYINKMSDYCKKCDYDIGDKTGDNSCPFNSLYWDFLDRNSDKLSHNQRLRLAYSSWNRMNPVTQDSYRARAKSVFNLINKNEI